MSQLDPIYATRSTLLVRLKDLDNQQAWQEFFDVYWTLPKRGFSSLVDWPWTVTETFG